MLFYVCVHVGILVALVSSVLPSAVLPTVFIAGLLGTLKYLVYGAHRGINLVTWLARGEGNRPPVACANAKAASPSADGLDGRVGLPAA